MSSLLSQSNIDKVTGIFARHFDTFSYGRNIIVHKEPLKTVTQSTGIIYPGYGNSSNEQNIVLTPVSGIFPVLQAYDKNSQNLSRPEIQTLFGQNKMRIKVKEDARLFIKNGRNEGFEIDNMFFNSIGEETVQNYFGLKYYYFSLFSTS